MNLQNELRSEFARLVTRRWFFRQCGVGLGSIALASLLADSARQPDRKRAGALAIEVNATATELGMTALTEQAKTLADSCRT